MLAQLGPYLIDEELAEGGMARVFRARLRGLGGFEKQLVIKQIRPELARDSRFVELFVREANTLVALSHPHIVQVYELGAAEGTYYLSMEYVEGATVASMLEEGPLSPALTAHLGAQICEALDYAHSRFGILHRDVTPRNIIVDQAGHARLLDFGIAVRASEAGGELFGSPGYMSPEQARGASIGPESDLFALGCVLFECVTGQPAYVKNLRASLTDRPDLARLCDTPAPLARLLASMLAGPREERPDAPLVSRSLREFLAQTRPEGVLHEMQWRASRSSLMARERRVQEAAQRKQDEAATKRVEPEPGTARVEAQSIATSPVLTEIMRSSGLAPIPKPPVPSASRPGAAAEIEGGTRRIRERDNPPHAADDTRSLPEDTHSPALTRGMLQAWPILALAAMAIALALAFLRAPRSPEATKPESNALPQAPAARTTATKPAPTTDVPQVQPTPTEALAPVKPIVDADAREAPGRALLSLNAMPWAEVSIDGKPQGVTPLRKLRLRAGVHKVELSCPPLGRTQQVTVDLPGKAEVRMVVDLEQDPPRTFLDGAKEVR